MLVSQQDRMCMCITYPLQFIKNPMANASRQLIPVSTAIPVQPITLPPMATTTESNTSNQA
jgi:hypothetical protein